MSQSPSRPTSTSLALANQEIRSLRIFHLYRLAVGSALLTLVLAGPELRLLRGLSMPGLFLAITVAYSLVAATGYLITMLRRLPLQPQVHAALGLDVITFSCLAALAGGTDSGLATLLIPTAAAAGLLLPYPLGFAYASASFFALLAALLPWSGLEQIAQIGVVGAVCFVAAGATHFLAERIRASEGLAAQRAKALQELAELSQTVFQRLQTGMVVMDRGGRVQLANGAGLRNLAVDDSAIGRPLTEISPPLAQQWATWRATPDRPGGPAQVVAEMPELLTAFMDLGHGERFDSLILLEDRNDAEARLQQVKLAALGRLSASIAHEIRNPLAAINNAAQLLDEDDSLPPAARHLTGLVTRNAARIDTIIEKALAASRREQARPRLMDLTAVLQRFAEEFRQTRRQEPVELALDLPESSLEVNFDPTHLDQILNNLCGNACVHGASADGTVRLLLRAGRDPGGSGPVYLEVCDQGPGIEAAERRKLFEPFHTTHVKGTGLGLYISRELCEFNRARLCHRDREPQGSCFRVDFAAERQVGTEWQIALH
jgi:two-component system sensor histidine kinase PilS (NtrC family)